jgi:4-carboxymuconolactone decarboxylase
LAPEGALTKKRENGYIEGTFGAGSIIWWSALGMVPKQLPAADEGGVMYLPNVYEKFGDKFADVFEHYQELGVKCREAGPIERKNQDLIKLGIAIGTNSRGGVMSHTRKALASGATPEEINHVVLLALTTTGFPNMIAAFGWIKEVLDSPR